MAAQGEQLDLMSLPSLVTEDIIQYLDLDTTKKLRLSCKALSEQCIGPHFKSFYRQQTTDLTEESLQSLYALASHPTLGPAVKDLTILAVVTDYSELEEVLSSGMQRKVTSLGAIQSVSCRESTEDELFMVHADLKWLQARQEELQLPEILVTESLASILGLFGALDSISLDTGIVLGRDNTEPYSSEKFDEVWTRAKTVYSLTMTAVARSGVTVDTLSIYRDTLRCSIQTCRITAHTANLDPADRLSFAGKSVKNLALSISPEIPEDFDMVALTGQSGCGIASLLELMPNLETLNLQMYRSGKGKTVNPDEREALEEFTQAVHLPSLQQCSWHGINFTEETMLQFLKSYPQITHLTLGNVHITAGSWTPILEHLSSNMPALTFLRLSNLWVKGRSLNLEPV